MSSASCCRALRPRFRRLGASRASPPGHLGDRCGCPACSRRAPFKPIKWVLKALRLDAGGPSQARSRLGTALLACKAIFPHHFDTGVPSILPCHIAHGYGLDSIIQLSHRMQFLMRRSDTCRGRSGRFIEPAFSVLDSRNLNSGIEIGSHLFCALRAVHGALVTSLSCDWGSSRIGQAHDISTIVTCQSTQGITALTNV